MAKRIQAIINNHHRISKDQEIPLGSPYRPPCGHVWFAGATISWIYGFSDNDQTFSYSDDHQSIYARYGPIRGQRGHFPPRPDGRKALPFDGATPYPERSRRNTLLLRRARDAAMPSQNHTPILPHCANSAPLPHGDSLPPATDL